MLSCLYHVAKKSCLFQLALKCNCDERLVWDQVWVSCLASDQTRPDPPALGTAADDFDAFPGEDKIKGFITLISVANKHTANCCSIYNALWWAMVMGRLEEKMRGAVLNACWQCWIGRSLLCVCARKAFVNGYYRFREIKNYYDYMLN